MNVEEHQFWTLFVSHKFTMQESCRKSPAISANGTLVHEGDVRLPETQKGSLLERHLDKTQLTKREEEKATFIPVDAPLDPSSLVSTQLEEAGNVSSLPGAAVDCSNIPLPVAEGQPDLVVQKHIGQTVDLNCESIKAAFTKLKLVSNGSLISLPEDSCPVFSVDSSPNLTLPLPVLDSGQKALDVPRIVRHKASSITFSDCSCTPAADSHAFVNESSDDGGSYPEEDDCLDDDDDEDHEDHEDEDDDNVFLELPQSRDHRYRSSSKDQQETVALSARTEIDHTVNTCGYEAEAETSSSEVCCHFKIIRMY